MLLKCVAALLLMSSMVLAQNPQEINKIKVVATFSVVGDLVNNVAGDKVDITVLVGPNADAHTFEPTPRDMVVMAGANVIFENGLHFEHWIDDLYTASGSKALRVVVSDGIETIRAANDEDPHVWHDVANAMIMVEHIKNALIKADPANEEYYKQNAENYLMQLGELNHWIIDALRDVPQERRKLVTSHDTFGYFADRYNFEVIGTVIDSATTEAADPSAAQIAQLIEEIKKARVKAIFVENMHNPKAVEMIAQEAGVILAEPLYTDALDVPGSDGDSYIKMMKHNAKVLAESLI